MRFITKIEIDKSDKKVISARVTVMILNALDASTPVIKN